MTSKGEEETTENREMDNKLKSKSKKREKKERGDRVMHDVEKVGADDDDAIVGEQKIEGDGVVETTMRKKKDKEKKKKNKKGRVDAGEVDVKGTSEDKSVGVFGKGGNGEGINDVERKKRKKEKNKKKKNDASRNAESEVGSAEEIDRNEGRERPEGGSVSKTKSSKKGCEEEKSQNADSSHKDAGEKVERKKRKREKKMDKDYDCFGRVGKENSGETLETFNEGQNNNLAEKVKRKKKKKNKNDEGDLSVPQKENMQENVDDIAQPTVLEGNTTNKTEKRKSKKKKKMKDDSSIDQQDSVDKNSNPHLNTDESREDEVKLTKVKKRKARLAKNVSEDTTANKSYKKVRFSGEVEVFPLPDDSDIGNGGKDNLVRGKRFTKQEDAIVNEAVWNYIEEHELGEEGLNMVLNCSKHPQLRGCWKEIGTAIPYRPYTSVYYRAQILFRRSEKREWTDEEYKALLKYQEEHGNQWRAIADELGKHRWHVKDCWRRIKFPNLRKGNWTQQEYQLLFDLVNEDLARRAFDEKKKSKHKMLLDDIPWSAISDKLSTRNNSTCCKKWYNQLRSLMVAQGIWDDVDDYRLLEALYAEDAGCIEDVDWDDLLHDRSGEVCRKRWSQMVMHIGHHGNKSFAEQVEVLAHRYCPHLKEAREAWDSKPVVT